MQDTVKEAFSAQRANAGNPSLWRLSVFRRFEQKRKGWGILATPAQVPATVYKTVVAADLYQGRNEDIMGGTCLQKYTVPCRQLSGRLFQSLTQSPN
jgi:hypothetical protein